MFLLNADTAVNHQYTMPGSGEWVIVLVIFLVLFFIFKAGQWRGLAGKDKDKKDNNSTTI